MEKYQFAINYPAFLTFLSETAIMYPDLREKALFAEIIKAAKSYRFPADDTYGLIAQSVLDKVERELHKELPKATWADMTTRSNIDLGREQCASDIINHITNVLRPHYDTEKFICHNEAEVADCDQWICSHCGINLTEWTKVVVDEEENDTTYHEYTFKFCPECGPKVVDRHE